MMSNETHRVEGVDIRVYSAAKTVADCFKYRNKIGLDIALEALPHRRDGWSIRACSNFPVGRPDHGEPRDMCKDKKANLAIIAGSVGH